VPVLGKKEAGEEQAHPPMLPDRSGQGQEGWLYMKVIGDELDLEVRSHRLHGQRFGSPSAPLVVGLHGLSLNMKAFDFVGERLGGDALQLVALDLRGRGHSDTTSPGTYGWDNHALDVLAVADVLGFERFSLVGQSMGGSVAMKAAEIDGARLDAVVLVDIAGRVDPGIGPAIAAATEHIDQPYASVESYLDAVKAQGLADPWNEYWDRVYRYQLVEGSTATGVRSLVDPGAVAEDRAYTLTQDPYARWRHLTMPTLLVRATREMRPGAGHVVPAPDRDRFAREVAHGTVVEVDANHLTVNTHPDTPAAIGTFLAEVSSHRSHRRT
jgi:pimeloyl-ACP methyl ester carboxylesterase